MSNEIKTNNVNNSIICTVRHRLVWNNYWTYCNFKKKKTRIICFETISIFIIASSSPLEVQNRRKSIPLSIQPILHHFRAAIPNRGHAGQWSERKESKGHRGLSSRWGTERNEKVDHVIKNLQYQCAVLVVRFFIIVFFIVVVQLCNRWEWLQKNQWWLYYAIYRLLLLLENNESRYRNQHSLFSTFQEIHFTRRGIYLSRICSILQR